MKAHIALLVFFLVPVFCLIPNTALAQESGSVINGSVSHGGFGAPVVKFSSINNDFGLFVGGRGGWIINFRPDHAFVLGGGGYGLSTDVEVDDLMRLGEPVYLTLGYGGVELEYVNRTRELVHFSVYTLIGGGGADYRNKGQNFEDRNGDSFFVMEPGASALLNVADFFRIGGGVSYRFTNGINLDGVSDLDVSGASAVLTFKFGSF